MNVLKIKLYSTKINKFKYFQDMSFTAANRFSDDAALRLIYDTYQRSNDAHFSDKPLPFTEFQTNTLFYILFAQHFCQTESSVGRIAVHLSESDDLDNYFKLNSMIMNSEKFSFNFVECFMGSNMNPSSRIDQFPHLTASDYED